MDKIVINPLKIDFHIHSEFSHFKDHELVKEGTIKNLSILIEKLNKNHIEMASITDHDVFSYEIYKELKFQEGKGTIKSILPGVEFSVGFNGDKGVEKQIHVIAIFNDKNEEKVANISKILPPNIKPNYENGENQFYSESKFRDILAQIDLDVLLISHQKNSPMSSKPRAKDANSVGNTRFNEFINYEYFDAYEFKSMKEGLFCNLFKKSKNEKREKMRFITGSDCHNWSLYPMHGENPNEDISTFEWTYLKCLPSFKGAKLALTDDSRISTSDNFFNKNEVAIDSLLISNNKEQIAIPLSKGLNVIIGDNSIGKSLLLHALTKFSKWEKGTLLPSKLKSAYIEVMNKENLEVLNPIDSNLIYEFDAQGEIRERFASGNSFKNNFILSKYPQEIDSEQYKEKVRNAFQKLYDFLNIKFEIDDTLMKLPLINLVDSDGKLTNIQLTNITEKVITDFKSTSNKIEKLTSKLNQSISLLETASKSKILEDVDKNILSDIIFKITNMLSKYDKKKNNSDLNIDILNSIHSGIENANKQINAVRTSYESSISTRDQKCAEVSSNIAHILRLKEYVKQRFIFNIEPINIKFPQYFYGDYKFICRFKGKMMVIDDKYLEYVLSSVLMAGSKLDPSTCTKDSLTAMIKLSQDSDENGKSDIELLKYKINKKIDEDFQNEKVILKKDVDVTGGMSDGFNSTAYFQLISYDNIKPGIYIVDQPEDDVSQSNIKTEVLKAIKHMASQRQVILITHNPLFVVNIDADNVIFLTKKNGRLTFESGALEYENREYNILNIVATNLDGGIDSLEKRWKRYDKEPLLN